MKRTALGAALIVALWSSQAMARTTYLNYVWAGNTAGQTGTVGMVFIHGHGNCTESSGTGYDSRCGTNSVGYWLNSTDDQGDGHDLLNEASSTALTSTSSATVSNGTVTYSGSWAFYDAFAIRYNGTDQGFTSATNDVGNCLNDLVKGTNSSGCNPNLYKRTKIVLVAHSEGGALVDRILSTGSWPAINTAIAGGGWAVFTLAGALAGAKSASALYGVDGAGNFCTTLVSWLAGWALKDTGTASLTRGSVRGETNYGRAGKSPIWVNVVTTTGGSGSCNNNSVVAVKESANDLQMGTLCGCIGTSSADDSDGVLWSQDTNPGTYNGGKSVAGYTGQYWHWIDSFANHSHNRNDAYATRYGVQTMSSCDTHVPGACIGMQARLQ